MSIGNGSSDQLSDGVEAGDSLDEPQAILVVKKFELRPPASQNVVDIFTSKWASDLGAVVPGVKAGAAALFAGDVRPQQLADAFGVGGRLDGMRVLELGPLEGGHTYQLERLGAQSIVAIEGNVEAYLKCLIVKELSPLTKSQFWLGDFLPYLETTEDRYDIVMCSGVLYHMTEPFRLIEAIGRVAPHCFVWTHYYDPEHYRGPERQPVTDPARPGVVMYAHRHQDRAGGMFWGSTRPVSVWLKRHDILDGFSQAGFGRLTVVGESVDHPNGACFTFAASRF
ncbi:MAG: hypothetical protein JO038_05425 [Alphaproteobacteria bacterium]|nr:hypothetical protein [Alphaproteobacteria bacterium]